MIIERNRVRQLLEQIYGEGTGASIAPRLDSILDKYRSQIPVSTVTGLGPRDAILITYPDQLQEPDKPPLQTLTEFCARHLKSLISGIHILPFYPSSSDDGFSVMDYRAVAPDYGGWDDVTRLGRHFRLMFDAVINHVSAQSDWFKRFSQGDPCYSDYFVEIKDNPDLSRVVRPRALPLLTRFGERAIWTTFSADQVDLNYHNPEVLLDVLDVLLFYVSRGAEFIRLDAIAYLWKEIGTSCVNLPQAHAVVQLIRAILNEIAPHVMLITETNVPHADNISYFGNGENEAQMVYNFSLPPLVLHAFQTGSAETLSRWAETLTLPSEKVTFFNFLASHDGIGLNPLRGILPEVQIETMAQLVKERGGFVSYKYNADGTQSPYELNINYFDALDNLDGWETLDLKVDRFITAHAILLSFMGMPAIYFHSLFGSRGWSDGVAQTGHNRAINRQKLPRREIERELGEENSMRAKVFQHLSSLLKIRAAHSAFAPYGEQHVLDCNDGVFALLRCGASEQDILCLHNVTAQAQQIEVNLSKTTLASSLNLRDLISNKIFGTERPFSISMQPYQTIWLFAEH